MVLFLLLKLEPHGLETSGSLLFPDAPEILCL